MSIDARTIGEEILGAEIVAGKELTEAAGGVFEAMERGAAIWLQQARWLTEDYGRFFRDSLSKPGDPASFFTLLGARSQHIAAGFQQFGEMVQKECAPVTKMWTDFAGTVEQDWRSG